MTGGASIAAHDLLRLLEPAVRPVGPAAGASRNAGALFESQRFDELLAQAFAGRVRSDRPIELACDLQPPLSHEQLQRLAGAADMAEAAGAQRAVMVIDGRSLLLEVTGRMIVGEVRPGDAQGMQHVDSVMAVPAPNERAAEDRRASAALGALQPRSPSVARLLQTFDGRADLAPNVHHRAAEAQRTI